MQVAAGNERADAHALFRARRRITLSNPGHPGATPGFEDNRSLQTEVFFEEYARGYAETTLGIAAGLAGRGALSVDAATAAAGGVASRGLIATWGFRFFFGRSGILNSNQYLRVGLGRDGRNLVFRASGSIVERFTESGHLVFKTYGKF